MLMQCKSDAFGDFPTSRPQPTTRADDRAGGAPLSPSPGAPRSRACAAPSERRWFDGIEVFAEVRRRLSASCSAWWRRRSTAAPNIRSPPRRPRPRSLWTS